MLRKSCILLYWFQGVAFISVYECINFCTLPDHMTNQTKYYLKAVWMVAKWMKWNVWNGISKVGHKTVEKFITVEHSNQTSMVSTLATFDQQFVETRNKLRSSILHSDAFHVHNNIIILSTLIYISLCVYKLCKAYWRRLALKSQLKIIETNVIGARSATVWAHARTRLTSSKF